MTRLRRLLVPVLSTLVMLALLLGLGTWQVERLAWKEGLLAQIARAEARPAVPLGDTPEPFAKVRASGLPALYGSQGHDTPAGPMLGAQLLAVLDRPGQAPLLVDRGWVPTAPNGAPGPLPAPPAGETVVEGFVRQPDHPGPFSAADDPVQRRFYTLDPVAIGHALGLATVAPFTLVAMGPPPPGQSPVPAEALPRPVNNHLSYTITWYGVAVVLLVIFVLYARKVLRP